MNTVHSTLADRAMQLAMIRGPQWFSHPDDQLDLVSVAWELAQSEEGNPGSIVKFARRRVRSKRHLFESARSITSDQPTRGVMLRDKWTGFSVEFVPDHRDDPVEFVIAKISWVEWLSTLTKRQRQMATRMRKGWSNAQLQSLFQISSGAVSQWRRKLWESFAEFLEE